MSRGRDSSDITVLTLKDVRFLVKIRRGKARGWGYKGIVFVNYSLMGVTKVVWTRGYAQAQ
jgi:hypothetical protein